MSLIKIGKIVNTHGIKGELRILSNFPYKDSVFQKGMTIYVDRKNKEIINSYRKHKKFDMITLEGYNNINDVLKYKGKIVHAERKDIKLPTNCYLDDQLLGLTVIYQKQEHGIISKIQRYDNVAILVVIYENKEYFLPYNKEIIDQFDMINRKIYIKNIKGFFTK